MLTGNAIGCFITPSAWAFRSSSRTSGKSLLRTSSGAHPPPPVESRPSSPHCALSRRSLLEPTLYARRRRRGTFPQLIAGSPMSSTHPPQANCPGQLRVRGQVRDLSLHKLQARPISKHSPKRCTDALALACHRCQPAGTSSALPSPGRALPSARSRSPCGRGQSEPPSRPMHEPSMTPVSPFGTLRLPCVRADPVAQTGC